MLDTQPIFRSIFADDWDKLPSIMHKHYANKPLCSDIVQADGKMDIKFGWFFKLLSPFLSRAGVLVPYVGKDIPVTVRFLSEPDSHAFCIERTFNFPNKQPYIFSSKLRKINNDIVVEMMKSFIGWKYRFYYDGKKIILEHRGYVIKIFGKTIPLPITLFIGKTYAEEEAINANNFRMKMLIVHPLFGKLYEYCGVFTIKGNAL